MARSKLTREEHKKEAKLFADLAERSLNDGNIKGAEEHIEDALGAIERARGAKY
ncbi:MAG TPA: hypothetical protein PLQ44_02135 [Candidatus Paceibacterota bacterium]|nr:hypothetical protein [Candidatus Paceibacterota bacterium]HPT40378.1 hypothetical protein [Candidatus Paceibacterota bacterium]